MLMTKMANVPHHIGIIIDGNRRWAKSKNLPTLEGHRRGYENVKKISKLIFKKGVKILTVWAFSTENWNRTKREVNYLMRLLAQGLNKKNIEPYHKMGTKIQIIGQRERLSKSIQRKIKEAEELTKNNKKNILNLAISYGGRAEIIEAIKKIIKKRVSAEKVTEKVINQNLWTEGLPCPDLIIRTGGHQRLSGFFSWQSAYSELYFLDKYWPDFNEKDLDRALKYYANCQRNFGK